MSEMIERVARVIDSRLRDVLEPGDLIWSRLGGPSNLALNIARAAMEAMREPGVATINACHAEPTAAVLRYHAALIDAALGSEPGTT